jgi:hypothetical protein
LFCCFIEVTMTVVKSVSDGLRDGESETQLNLNRPLRISPGPRHLSRPLAAISTSDNRPEYRVLAISDAGITRHTPLKQKLAPTPAAFRMSQPPSASSGSPSFPRSQPRGLPSLASLPARSQGKAAWL